MYASQDVESGHIEIYDHSQEAHKQVVESRDVENQGLYLVNPTKDRSIVWLRLGAIVALGLAYIVGVVLLLPMVVVLLAVSAYKGISLQEFCAKYIALPSQRFEISELDRIKEQSLAQAVSGVTIRHKRVKVNPRTYLDGMAYTPEVFEHRHASEQKWIVFMVGRNGAHEYKAAQCARMAKELGVGVLIANWKGVGHSQGVSLDSDSLVEDGLAMINSLERGGVPPHNICIYGHSLGGAVGARVAKICQDDGRVVGFVNDRSFADASSVVRGVLGWLPGIRHAVSFISRKWWNLNPINDFMDLKGFTAIAYSHQDGIIHHGTAGLYARIKILTGRKPLRRLKLIFPGMNRQGVLDRIRLGIRAHCRAIPSVVLKQFMRDWLVMPAAGREMDVLNSFGRVVAV